MVDGFTELIEKQCLPNALMRMESQGGNCLGFIKDYCLKGLISVKIAGRFVTGRSLYRKNLPELTRLPVGVGGLRR